MNPSPISFPSLCAIRALLLAGVFSVTPATSQALQQVEITYDITPSESPICALWWEPCGAVINDDAGGRSVVLIGDAATRSVRAYDGGGLQFTALAGRDDALTAAGEIWEIGEEALTGPAGRRLQRLAGHIAYWFAWTGFRAQTPLYQPQ